MPSQYLTLQDCQQYGLTSATSPQIIQASALIDAYLRRPEGLVWAPDSTGNPCYMTALVPSASMTLTGGISPGANVAVTLSGNPQILQVGDVVIVDRATPALTEACVIATTTSPPNGAQAITFQKVINAHALGATVELGLVIEEQRYMPENRPLTQLSRAPLVNVISGVGRYGYGRRGDHADYNMEQFNLLAAVNKFGGPPVWELFQSAYPSGWDVQTAQVWVPAGIMLAYYSEVKLRYIAGFNGVAAVPGPIKNACVEIMQAQQNAPPLGNVKSFKAGDTAVARFSASLLSDDTKAALSSYGARAYV